MRLRPETSLVEDGQAFHTSIFTLKFNTMGLSAVSGYSPWTSVLMALGFGASARSDKTSTGEP